MKKLFALLLLAITVMVSTASATTKGAHNPTRSEIRQAAKQVPQNLTIRQSITLTDGTQLTVYYVKEGNQCSVYSEQNLSGYSVSDLLRIKKTDFERVDSHRGKLQVSRSAKQLVNLFRSLAKQI